MSNNNDDAIGQTIYSKQWTIKLVKKIVEVKCQLISINFVIEQKK